MLNLSLISTGGDTNLTVINVTIGNISIANVSSVSILNSSGTVLVANATNSTSSVFMVHVPSGVNVTSSAINLLIGINMSSSAAVGSNVYVLLNNTAAFGIDSGSNVTFGNSVNLSYAPRIQDVHANASITPLIVDTNVINQSFVYNVSLTGIDKIDKIFVNVPAGFNIVNVTGVNFSTGDCVAGNNCIPTFSPTRINVTFSSNQSSSTLNPLRIFFIANTSATPASGFFNSNITGSNLTEVSTDALTGNQTNATVKQVLNVTNIGAMKFAALSNGTDYWEFNFTINVTDTSTGLLQFKMSNWNDSSGNIINLASANTTLRSSSDFNTTSKFNITNDYNITQGLSYTGTSGLITIFLRMVIPVGTPVSSTWYTTYNMLFRSTA
jgi:hypothetical protein